MARWSLAQDGHLQFRKDDIKLLNMMGNDPQRTGYVVSTHLLTPWHLLEHPEYPKNNYFIRCHQAYFLALLTYRKHMEDNR